MATTTFPPRAPFVALLGLSLVSCGASVGYSGPIPSVAARQSLGALWGRTLPAGSVAFTSRGVTLRAFVVGPQAPTVVVDEVGVAKDPGDGRVGTHWIPVLQDGDIADLHLRATGAVPAGIAGPRSDAYRRMVEGREGP